MTNVEICLTALVYAMKQVETSHIDLFDCPEVYTREETLVKLASAYMSLVDLASTTFVDHPMKPDPSYIIKALQRKL